MKTPSVASLLCGTFPIKQPLSERGDAAPGGGPFRGAKTQLVWTLSIRMASSGQEGEKKTLFPLRSDHLAFKTNERCRSGLIPNSVALFSSAPLNNEGVIASPFQFSG